MQLATDYIHPAPRGGRCRVRVFLPDEPERDAPVIVCTELANNPGQSVTNAAPRIMWNIKPTRAVRLARRSSGYLSGLHSE